MSTKKLLLLTLVFVCVVGGTFAGGTQQAAAATDFTLSPPGSLPIVDQKVTISAFVPQSAWISDMIDNLATIELERRTNVQLNLLVVLDEGAAERKSILLASGDYPEVFFGGAFNNNDVLTYGVEHGVFQPINDLIDTQGVNVQNVFEYYPNLRADITAPDGNIYGLPHINECYHCSYAQKMWINMSWLENLGLSVPTTTEEFYDVLMAVKTQDANLSGDPNDEIPLMGSILSWNNDVWPFLMNPFVYTDGSSFLASNDGILSFSPAQPEWREGLRYIRRLYSEGLIYPASFTQTREQAQTIGDNPGKALFFAGTAGHLGMYMRIEDNPPYDRHREYAALAPLEGPTGLRQTPVYRGFSGASFVITDKARYPEVAFRVADYMYSEEGTMLMEVGPEGVRWEPARPGELGLTGEPARFRDLSEAMGHGDVRNTDWGQQATTVRTGEWRAAWAADQDMFSVQGYELRLHRETAEKYEPYGPREWFSNVFLQPEEVEEVALLATDILDYVRQATVQFIVGELSVDRDWDSYLAQLRRLNLDRYMQIHQEAWTAKLQHQ
jgi:putative aldouronate transport system substrate-binding protein